MSKPRLLKPLLLASAAGAIRLCAQPAIELLTVEYQHQTPPPWAPLCHCLPSDVSPEFLGSFLRLAEGMRIDSAALREDLLRVQATGACARVGYRTDTLGAAAVELRWQITPRCRHVLAPALRVGPHVRSLGLWLHLASLWSGAERLVLEILSRRELSIGTEGRAELSIPLGTALQIEASARAHRYRTAYSLGFSAPPLWLPTRRWTAGGAWNQTIGQLWDFRRLSPQLYARRAGELHVWLRWGMSRRDALYITLSGTLSSARTDSGYRQPFDNTALALLGIGSLRQRTERLPSPEVYGDSCTVTAGAWGAVVLGMSFPTTAEGERGSYLAGELEQSVASDGFVAAGRIAAGNAFLRGLARYTVLETAFQGWIALPAPLLLAWKGGHRNVWNWSGAYRAERLDVTTGFPLPFPATAADNLMELRMELRWRGNAWAPELGWTAVVFSHVGAVWNQGRRLSRVHFISALGAGLWWHIGGQRTERWSLRAELAYTPTLRRLVPRLWMEFGGSELVFHRYRLPRILGVPSAPEP